MTPQKGFSEHEQTGLRIGAAYIRVSTDDQIEYSPESQLEKIQSYAKANGIIIPPEFIFMEEEGRSGRSTKKRTEFNRMIGTAKLKPKPFDVVLLWKFSRFARSREDSILYKSMLRRDLGIDVISVSEPVGDDKMSILIEAIIEAMDEYYSINLAEEVRRGMTQRAKRGRPNAYAPIGYKMDNGRYVPDPDTAPIVRKIYADYISGKPELGIVHELNDMGIRTRFGNRIDNRFVHYVLHNPVYIGKVHWTPSGRTRRVWDNPETMVVDSDHEPLIDQQTYEAAQERLEHYKRTHPPHARADGRPFVLKGLVRCSCCGSTLVMAAAGKSLQCHRYSKGQCPESHSITIAQITDTVLQQIRSDFLSADFAVLSADTRKVVSDADGELIEKQIQRERLKLRRAREAYEAGVDTLEEYKAAKERIQQQIERLEKSRPAPTEIITPEHFIKLHEQDLAIALDPTASDAARNESLRTFVQSVIFDRKNSTISIQYYA